MVLVSYPYYHLTVWKNFVPRLITRLANPRPNRSFDHLLVLLLRHAGQVYLIWAVMRTVHDNDRPLNKIGQLFGVAVMWEGKE